MSFAGKVVTAQPVRPTVKEFGRSFRDKATVVEALNRLNFRVAFGHQTYLILRRLCDDQYREILRFLAALREDFARRLMVDENMGISLVLPWARNLGPLAKRETIDGVVASERAMGLIRTDFLDLAAWGGPKLDLSALPIIIQRSLQ